MKQQVFVGRAAVEQVSGETRWSPRTVLQESCAAAGSASEASLREGCRAVGVYTGSQEVAPLQLDTDLAGTQGGVRLSEVEEYCQDGAGSTNVSVNGSAL